jgi:hypothetical protein
MREMNELSCCFEDKDGRITVCEIARHLQCVAWGMNKSSFLAAASCRYQLRDWLRQSE